MRTSSPSRHRSPRSPAPHSIGRVVASTPLPDGLGLIQDLGGTHITARLTFPADGVMRSEVVDWGGLKPDQTSVSAASDGNEHFFGFGEKFSALDQAGNVVDILTFDNPGSKGDRSYKAASWFISTRCYGFHLDSTARSTFDMRAAMMGRYTITNQVGTLKFNVVYGPALTDVLSRYTGFTGRPALPPPFAFGPWISSDIWRDRGEVNYAVTNFRERGIPFPRSSSTRLGRSPTTISSSTSGTQGRPSSATPARSRGCSRGSPSLRHDDLPPQERAEGHLLDDFVHQCHLERRTRARPEPGRGQAGQEGGPLFRPRVQGRPSPRGPLVERPGQPDRFHQRGTPRSSSATSCSAWAGGAPRSKTTRACSSASRTWVASLRASPTRTVTRCRSTSAASISDRTFRRFPEPDRGDLQARTGPDGGSEAAGPLEHL